MSELGQRMNGMMLDPLPEIACQAINILFDHIDVLEEIAAVERKIVEWHKTPAKTGICSGCQKLHHARGHDRISLKSMVDALEECVRRDPKGLYKRPLAGHIQLSRRRFTV